MNALTTQRIVGPHLPARPPKEVPFGGFLGKHTRDQIAAEIVRVQLMEIRNGNVYSIEQLNPCACVRESECVCVCDRSTCYNKAVAASWLGGPFPSAALTCCC